MWMTRGIDSVIQAPRLLTTYSQCALFLPQMSIQTDTIVIVRALGMIKKRTQKYINKIPGNLSLAEIQKIA